MKKQKGIIIVISGPTGSGKGTVTYELIKKHKNFERLKTYTTRKRRPKDKKTDYFFISKKEFEKRIMENFFIEHTYIKEIDTYYGTGKKYLENRLNKGITLIANVNYDGTKVFKKLYPNTLTIYIKPDKISNIRKRILKRTSKISKEELNNRIDIVRREAKEETPFYQYRVINYQNKLNQTVKKTDNIIKKYL